MSSREKGVLYVGKDSHLVPDEENEPIRPALELIHASLLNPLIFPMQCFNLKKQIFLNAMSCILGCLAFCGLL